MELAELNIESTHQLHSVKSDFYETLAEISAGEYLQIHKEIFDMYRLTIKVKRLQIFVS